MGPNKNLGTNSWSSFFSPTEIFFSTCLKWSQGARIRGHETFLDIVTVILFIWQFKLSFSEKAAKAQVSEKATKKVEFIFHLVLTF